MDGVIFRDPQILRPDANLKRSHAGPGPTQTLLSLPEPVGVLLSQPERLRLLFHVCLFVWFTGVTPAEPRCVIVVNMVPFTATQTPSAPTQMGGCSI